MMFFRSIGYFLLLITLSACAELPYNNIDNKQLKSMLEQDVAIVDIRRPEEWKKTGVVEGSQLLTFVDAEGRLMPDFVTRFTMAVGKDDPVILICRTGNRTATLSRLLSEQLGYTQIHNVRDGITRWIKEGQSIVRL